jgi:hypothetical protein
MAHPDLDRFDQLYRLADKLLARADWDGLSDFFPRPRHLAGFPLPRQSR